MAVVMLPPRRPHCGNYGYSLLTLSGTTPQQLHHPPLSDHPRLGVAEQPFAATMAALYVPLSASIHDLPQNQTGRD